MISIYTQNETIMIHHKLKWMTIAIHSGIALQRGLQTKKIDIFKKNQKTL